MEILNLSNVNLYILIIVAIVNSAVLCLVASKLFQIIQLAGYKFSGYMAWLKDTKIKFVGRLIMLCVLSLICFLVSNSLLRGFNYYYCYLGIIFYVYFCVVFIINMTKIPQKTPLKQTRRMTRLIITVAVITFMVSFAFIVLSTRYVNLLRYGVICFVPPLMILIVPIAHIINLPLELSIRLKYIKRAKAKLAKRPDLIKIGITGSYGKTSTKHILNVILSKKYKVCMTPHSFNTPMGLTKVVLKYLKKKHQVLITEMGARNVGDIKYLCDLIQPHHGIITAVGSQHLSTFGSVENVAKTKNELVEYIKNGFVVFNGESNNAVDLYSKCNKKKCLCGINNKTAYCNIFDIKLSSKGTEFKLQIEDNIIDCKTKLLGEHILENISMACAVAYKLGVGLDDIQDAIKNLTPMPHRMEVIKNNNLTVLDNSYNTSVESSKASLNVLKLFENCNKIIVTPGIIEMGNMEYEVNYNFGRDIAKVCNNVIIVNKANLAAIKEGLLDAGFNEENIMQADTLKLASEILPTITKSGDVVLFENDLPDNYT